MITLQNGEEIMRERKVCADREKDRPCIKFVYPVTYLMPDGTTVSGDDKESVLSAIKAWYTDHPEVQEKPALQYPLDIIFMGKSIALQNEYGMARKKVCTKNDDRKPCFRMVYPVTYGMPDGSTVAGNDREEVGAAIKSWYTDHRDVQEKPSLQYPVVVIFGDKRITLNNVEEMIGL